MGKRKFVDCWTYPKPVLDEKLKEIKSDYSKEIETLTESIEDLSGDFEDLGESVEKLSGDIETMSENVADAYNSEATYAVGDLCIYENTLYKCTTAIETAEEWTAGHWTQTNIADEIVKHDTVTLLTTTSQKFTIDNSTPIKKCSYMIRNKICYASIYLHCVSPASASSEEICDMPEIAADMGNTVHFLMSDYYSNAILPANIQSGKLYVRGGIANTDYSLTFSYPID